MKDDDTDNGMRMLAYFIMAVVLIVSPVCAVLIQVLRVMK